MFFFNKFKTSLLLLFQHSLHFKNQFYFISARAPLLPSYPNFCPLPDQQPTILLYLYTVPYLFFNLQLATAGLLFNVFIAGLYVKCNKFISEFLTCSFSFSSSSLFFLPQISLLFSTYFIPGVSLPPPIYSNASH